jgi:hypothetical protein
MRLIFVPQYPTPNRYQEWWAWKFPEEFRKVGYEVVVLGSKFIKERISTSYDPSMFSPINAAIDLETAQIKEYCMMERRVDDVMFVADISFPGFFCNVLFHHRPAKLYGFCHATSLNKYDYFEQVRRCKFPVETSHAAMFNKIFVGSQYHATKLNWPNVVVTSLPNPDHIKTFTSEVKHIDIASASRPGKQKVDKKLEMCVQDKFGPITRRETNTPEEYYKFLGESKVLLITSHEDTFGYQIVDAINNNCIPIARNACSYPELLQPEYLYNTPAELYRALDMALWGLMQLPKLRCRDKMKNFYNTIIKEMVYAV